MDISVAEYEMGFFLRASGRVKRDKPTCHHDRKLVRVLLILDMKGLEKTE
jgi:hypothetical protein